MAHYTYDLHIVWVPTVLVTDESDRLLSWSIDRGRDSPFVSVEAGKLVLTLDNSDGRFDPWNASSPLYPYVTPGKRISFEIGLSTDWSGPAMTIFSGYIYDVIPSGRLGQRTVQLVCYDAFKQARDALIIEDEKIISFNNGDLIHEFLGGYFDWISGVWNHNVSSLVGSTEYTFPIGGAGLTARALIESELGYFFESDDGFLTGYGRDYNGWAFTVELKDSDLVDLSVNQPWEYIVNRAFVTAHVPSVASSATVLYTLPEPVFIEAGGARVVIAKYSDENGAECNATDFSVMVSGTDYKANSQADGLGTDLTADLEVVAFNAMGYTKFYLTNKGGSDFYVTVLQRSGKVISYDKVTVMREDTDSQETYGGHELSFDYPYCQSSAVALDYAYAIVSFWKDPQKCPVLRMRHKLEDVRQIILYFDNPPDIGDGDDYPMWALPDLFNLVHLDSDSYDIDDYFLIGKMRMWTGSSLQDVWMEWKLEPYDNRRFWELGTTGYTELGSTTVLGF